MKDRFGPSFLIDMRHSILVAAALTLLASNARAEGTPEKSPTTATVVSVGATVAPILVGAASGDASSAVLLMGGGLLLGPSAGHWYAGEAGWRGLAIRSAGFATMALVIDDVGGCLIGDGGEEGKNCDRANTAFMVGAGMTIAGVLYDIGTAGSAARRHNTRTVQIAPTMVSGTRSTGAGLGISGAF